jgi:iron complex transport system ATP-binding protein
MIVLRDVALRVGGHPLLSKLDARIETGEFVALIGPNGVGKTTLLRAVAGLHPLRGGTILLDGTPSSKLTHLERARRAAFVTGDEVLLDALAVRDVVSMGRFPHHRWWQWQTREADERAVAQALAAVQLEEFADRLFSTLSAGERQRVWIALGLAQQTPILLLDEPTSHLDMRVAHEILALLRALARAGKTVFSALHDLNEAAAYADRIALLGDRTLLALSEPDALLRDRLIERVYGIAMERVVLPDGRLRVFACNGEDATDEASSVRRNRVPSA